MLNIFSHVSGPSVCPPWRSVCSGPCKRGENRHPCLVPDLKGNVYSFCPLSMMLAVCFSYMVFIILRYALSIPTLLSVFIINGRWTLSNALSASVDMIMCFFVLC